MEFIEVDGSEGEGGGQILRSAVSFATIMRKPVRVTKVRAGREVQGLKRQHVSSLRVIAEIFGSKLTGAEEGSREISLVPGEFRHGDVSIDMGTAASIPLVLQAVVPAVSLSGSALKLDLVGGTDVPWSPTFDYFASVVSRAFKDVGVKFSAVSSRRGYYPRGGGRASVAIEPCKGPLPLKLDDLAPLSPVRITSRCGMLPRHVAERQAQAAASMLKASGIEVMETTVTEEQSSSPGSSILTECLGPLSHVGSDGLGAKGVRAEEVGESAASRLTANLQAGARVDEHVADMLVPILSFAKVPSRFRTSKATSHLESSLNLARQFTGCSFEIARDGRGVLVSVTPTS